MAKKENAQFGTGKTALIIYHFEDNDGVCSGAMFNWYLRHFGFEEKNIAMIGANYAQLAAIEQSYKEKHGSYKGLFGEYDHLVMTDISFNNWEVMKSLWEQFGSRFVWCDHHKPIIEQSIRENFDDIPGLRDTQCSAILCAYRFLFDQLDAAYNSNQVPPVLGYLSSWDSWSWVREGLDEDWIRSFNVGVTNLSKLSLDFYYPLFDDWLLERRPLDGYSDSENDRFINSAVELGKIFVDKDKSDAKRLIDDYGDGEWKVADTRKAMMVVMHGPSGSQTFKSVKGEYDNGIVFKHLKNGNWTLSLYNTTNEDSFDCGTYLKEKYNGGGHKGAAGCTITPSQFFSMLEKKEV